MKKLLLIALLIFSLPAVAAEKESVFDRVTRTGTINCGYALWAPVLYKDAKTGDIKGLFYDVMTEAAKRLSLKVVWKEETAWGTIVEGLHTNRYDMICTGLAATSARAKFIDFSAPLFFSPIYLVARADDTRFDKDTDVLNDAKYKIGVLDGEISSIIAQQKFPQAAVTAMPQTADYSLLLKEVETKKADVTIIEIATFLEYEAHNKGKLKIIQRDRPLNVFAATLGVPIGDISIKHMMDTTLNEMMLDGTIAALIKKHEKFPGTMLLPTQPYQPPAK